MSPGKMDLFSRLETAVLASDSSHGRATGLLRPWRWWERFTLHFWPIQWWGQTQTIGIRKGTYHGNPRTLVDGTMLQRGDPMLEIHLNGPRLMELTGTADQGHWATIRAVRSDLLALAEAVSAGNFGEVQALHGITLYTVPARWLGFELEPVRRTIYWRLNQFFMRGLSRIYEPGSARKSREARVGPWPHEVWLGRIACGLMARPDERRP